MMLKFLPVLCILVVCYCYPTENKSDLDSIIEDIFGSTEPATLAYNGTNQDSKTRLKKADTGDKCSTTEGQEGKCIPYYFCNTPLNVNGGIIDIKLPMDEPCSFAFDVCCLEKDIITTTHAPAPTNVSTKKIEAVL